MTKKKVSVTSEKKHERILFFDVLRITFVALIVYGHSQFAYFAGLNNILYMDGRLPFNIYPLGLTGISVFGMIFVSGAVLEYNYKKIERFSEYMRFLFKRFIRLYPAFWMSLLFSIILFPWVLQNGLFSTFMEFTGFFFLLGQGPGYLNTMGWFIGTIFCLYVLFPFLSKIVKKYRLWSLLIFLAISYLSRFLLFSYTTNPLNILPMWLPICNLFEFGLGIYLIQNTLYPKTVNNYPFIQKLSELSFYVFLFHTIITDAFFLDLQNKGPIYYFFANLGMRTTEISYPLWYFGLMLTILIISGIAMIIDEKLQKKILQNVKVRQFLKGK
jgi:peptidoglycan/LPS O-acetylase OafA/YrhL